MDYEKDHKQSFHCEYYLENGDEKKAIASHSKSAYFAREVKRICVTSSSWSHLLSHSFSDSEYYHHIEGEVSKSSPPLEATRLSTSKSYFEPP